MFCLKAYTVILSLLFCVSEVHYFLVLPGHHDRFPLETRLRQAVTLSQMNVSSIVPVSNSQDIPQFPTINLRERLFTNISDSYKRPIITDIFAIPQNASMLVYAVFSALNLPLKNASVEYNNFTLIYGDTIVPDRNPIKLHVEALRVLTFILPIEIQEAFFYVDIEDKVRKNVYKKLSVEVLSNQKLGGIAACAMLSDFNSLGEMMSWVAWHKYQHLTNVMVYSIKPVPLMEEVIERVNRFVRYYKYDYPLNGYRDRREQRSIQLAVINSCFYRHKHQYDGIALIDLDEFIFSPSSPQDAAKALSNLLQTKRGEYFQIFSTMYYLKASANRTESFENGTVFSDYVWKEPSRFSGRVKYMLRSTSESSLSTHYCVGCRWASETKEDIIMLMHFKANHKNKTELTFDDSMKMHTPFVQQELDQLFR